MESVGFLFSCHHVLNFTHYCNLNNSVWTFNTIILTLLFQLPLNRCDGIFTIGFAYLLIPGWPSHPHSKITTYQMTCPEWISRVLSDWQTVISCDCAYKFQLTIAIISAISVRFVFAVNIMEVDRLLCLYQSHPICTHPRQISKPPKRKLLLKIALQCSLTWVSMLLLIAIGLWWMDLIENTIPTQVVTVSLWASMITVYTIFKYSFSIN